MILFGILDHQPEYMYICKVVFLPYDLKFGNISHKKTNPQEN